MKPNTTCFGIQIYSGYFHYSIPERMVLWSHLTCNTRMPIVVFIIPCNCCVFCVCVCVFFLFSFCLHHSWNCVRCRLNNCCYHFDFVKMFFGFGNSFFCRRGSFLCTSPFFRLFSHFLHNTCAILLAFFRFLFILNSTQFSYFIYFCVL